MNAEQTRIRKKIIEKFITGISFLLLAVSCKNKQAINGDDYLNPYFDNYNKADGESKFKALISLDSAFNSFKQPSVNNQLKRYLIKAQYAFDKDRNTSDGLLYADSLITLAKKNTNAKETIPLLVKGLEYKGYLNLIEKRYDEGVKYFAESKSTISQYLSDSCGIDYSNVFPNVLYRQGKYELAIQYYKKNLLLSLQCKPLTFDRYFLAQDCLNNIALSYNRANSKDTALYYIDSALSFINSSKILFPGNNSIQVNEGVTYNTRAYIKEALGLYSDAEKYYLRSIALVEKDYFMFSIDTRFALTKMYMARNDFERAEKMLDTLDKKILGVKEEDYIRDYYLIKSSFFEKTKNYDSALANFKLYDKYKTSFASGDRTFMHIDMEKDRAAKQTELQNELLTRDISIKNSQLTIVALICLLSIAVIGFIWNYYKVSSRHVKELQQLTNEVTLNHEQLQKSFASLEQSHAENKNIMRVVAHDLKNPISGIQMLTHAVKQTADNKETISSMELIGNTCESLLATINNMLSSKNDISAQQKELVDIGWLLENCTQLLQAEAAGKNQKLSLHTKSIVLWVNREKIWRVMSNLIHNAIKFSDEGSVIRLNLAELNNTAVLSVKDNGIGIPSEMKDEIFVMEGASKSRTGTMGEQSHGLGLSIVKKIVDEHGGNIWFESKEGEGTIFYVSLPLQTTA